MQIKITSEWINGIITNKKRDIQRGKNVINIKSKYKPGFKLFY